MAGIFSLGEVRTEQVNNTWPEEPNFGYFANGSTIDGPGASSEIERLDFSNETTSLPGNKSSVYSWGRAAVLSSEYGYVAGGLNPGAAPAETTTMDRLDFITETTSVPAPTLVYKRSYLAGVSTPQYGYFAGGGPSPDTICAIQRLDLSTETISNPPASLPNTIYNLAGVPTPQYGYFAGGSYLNTIHRMDFSTELTSTLPATLPERRGGLSAVSNDTHAYFAGGVNIDDGVQYLCTIDRLEFSTETATALGDSLSTPAASPSGGVSNRLYGYFGGHLNPADSGPSSLVCNIQRLDFSSETMNVLSDVLNAPAWNSAGTPSGTSGKSGNHARKILGTDIDGKPISSTYGYFAGGQTVPVRVCTIDRLDFSTETSSNPPANLTQARGFLAAVSNNSYGYFACGDDGGTPLFCTIDRLDFSTETSSNPPANLTQGKSSLTAVSNSNYGYFGGGKYIPTSNAVICTIDRLDFSTETTSAPGNDLTQARSNLAAVSTSEYGYFAGGFGPPQVCTIDRLDFSNETTSNPPSNLTQARNSLVAVSTPEYGYFAGGFDPPRVCTIDRLDFSNETTSNPPSNLTQARNNLAAAVSNSSYGYFAGGYGEFNVLQCTIDRLDFSNETTSNPSANLTEARNGFVAVSN